MAEQGIAGKANVTSTISAVKPVVEAPKSTNVKIQVQKIVEEVKPAVTTQPQKLKGPTVKEKSWMYHKDLPPVLLDAGQEIPEGFIPENKFGWYKDQNNNFIWRK